jgi:ADP-heptose:LPS heptosyltransferase
LLVDFHHPPSTENNLRLVEAVGCRITTRSYAGLLRPTAAQAERAEKIMSLHGVGAGDRIVALAPGTSGRRSVKEWTDEGFAEVGRHLADMGFRVLVLGTVPAYSIVKEYGQIIDLSGKTDLGEAVAVLARCELLVSVDSGILHLAAAAGTRVVGLYGPSDPTITGPQGEGHVVLTAGVECSPCVRTECKYERQCMTNLNSAKVIAAAEQALSRARTQ